MRSDHKPNSVSATADVGHSSGPVFTDKLVQSTRPYARTTQGCLILLLSGVYLATLVTNGTGGLLHHPFTCFHPKIDVYSLLHLPPLTGPSISEALCSMEFGLSSLNEC